ncbi:MAG TPA: sigma-70 family RNA polymerase sigma factor [Pseudonocardiaceae bacterium]
MTEKLLAQAQAGDSEAFRELTDPYRRELQLHCYRFLGSVQDAEDLVQETMLAAWRGLQRFEGRSSLRAWLYRIASNRCLNALRDRDRRATDLPAGLPSTFLPPTETVYDEPAWLEPLPDAVLEDSSPGPEARWEAKESISLAFIAAMQHLPPRQRAILLLRDVLGYRAAEVADMLDATEDSVNGLLKRARATLADRYPPGLRAKAALPTSGRDRELADRFAEALQRGDMNAVLDMLTQDAWFSMPPEPYVWRGRETVARFLAERFSGHRYRLIPTTANGQPAFALYLVEERTSVAHAHGLVVLTFAGEKISVVTRFVDTGIFSRFGLPRTLRN